MIITKCDIPTEQKLCTYEQCLLKKKKEKKYENIIYKLSNIGNWTFPYAYVHYGVKKKK